MSLGPVSPEITHLIQETLLPQSSSVHVAEVFLSGLLDVTESGSYQFAPGIKEMFRETTMKMDERLVFQTLSSYVSNRYRQSPREFKAFLKKHSEWGEEQWSKVEGFAELRLQLQGIKTVLGGLVDERSQERIGREQVSTNYTENINTTKTLNIHNQFEKTVDNIYSQKVQSDFPSSALNVPLENNSLAKRILVLIANPQGISNLDLLPEMRDLQEALQLSAVRDRFVTEWRIVKHQRDLRRYILDAKPQILHVCGHGTQQGLVLKDDTDTTKVIPNEALTDLLRIFSAHIECVVLNECYSSSLANSLGQHLNYVIYMNHEAFDDEAISFAKGFYDALGAGESYQRAFMIGQSEHLIQKSTRAGESRKATVVDEHSEPISPKQQEHLIPSLIINPKPKEIKPWRSLDSDTRRI